MVDLLQCVAQNILDRRLLKKGQKVLVAVSGGLDSMTLLHVLRILSIPQKWKLTVAHFNHQLRGSSSDSDEQLVRRTAGSLKLPFVAGRADVRKFAETSKLSIEMAARKLRHEFFVHTARERKIPTVALAHHADDQVELFFLRLLRGAGGEGLAGMKWRSASPVEKKIGLVRPLLDVTKLELRVFAKENKIQFCEDATNAGLDLPRNRIRNELLPLLRKHYQPAVTRTVLRLMEILGAETEVVGETARSWLEKSGRDGPPARPRTPQRGVLTFGRLPVAVQRRVVQLQLAKLGVWADFVLVERLRCTTDVLVGVSPGFSVTRDVAGVVTLRMRAPVGFKVNELAVNLASRAGKMDFGGIQFRWSFENTKGAASMGKKTNREFFDADKVGERIILRHWQAGDRFQPIGLKSPVKLQDLFMNQKIPRARRHNLVVAEAANGQIFWVQNLRMSEPFKLTARTKRRLVWRWRCASC